MNRWAVAALCVPFLACAEESPVEKCDRVVDVLCGKAVECLGGDKNQCVQEVTNAFACGKVVSVGASYDRCVDQIDNGLCSVLFTNDPSTGDPQFNLPGDCQGVFSVN